MAANSGNQDNLDDLTDKLRKKYEQSSSDGKKEDDEFSKPSEELEEAGEESLLGDFKRSSALEDAGKENSDKRFNVEVSASSTTPEDVSINVSETETIDTRTPPEKVIESKLESSVEKTDFSETPPTEEEPVETPATQTPPPESPPVEPMPESPPIAPEPIPPVESVPPESSPIAPEPIPPVEPMPESSPVEPEKIKPETLEPTKITATKPARFENKKKFLIIGGITIILIILISTTIFFLTRPTYDINYSQASAGEAFQTLFSTNQNLASVKFVFTHELGEVQDYNAVKTGNEWTVDNIRLLRSGIWTLEIISENKVLLSRTVAIPESCLTDEDCESLCCYGACVEPECENNISCFDNDTCTIDTCLNPGTCESRCTYQRITSFIAGDNCCPRGATREDDLDCTNCPTGKLLCNDECFTPACLRDSDCDDGDFSTRNVCYQPNTCTSYCGFASVCSEPDQVLCNNRCTTPACLTDNDCDDSDPITTDTCLNPRTCEARCVYTGPSCTNDANCPTGMKCCDNICTKPSCTTFLDCDDSDPSTNDYCLNPGTCESVCSNVQCTIACNSDANCPTGRKCYNPGTCSSVCAVCLFNSDCTTGKICCNNNCITPACNSDADCGFGQTCYNPGTCTASCGTISCSTYLDCLSGQTCCNTICTSLNCGQQYWTNTGLNQTLMIGGNNISNILLTMNNSADNSVIIHVFDSTGDLQKSRHSLPYSNQYLEKGFNFTVINYDDNINNATILWSVFCPAGTYCKDYNQCTNACVDCLQDNHCNIEEICCNNNCVEPVCNSTLLYEGEIMNPAVFAQSEQHQYFSIVNNSHLISFDGFVRLLPIESETTGPFVDIDVINGVFHGVTLNAYFLNFNPENQISFNIEGEGKATSFVKSGYSAESDRFLIGFDNGTIFQCTPDQNAEWHCHSASSLLFESSVTKLSRFDKFTWPAIAGFENGQVYKEGGGVWTLKNSFNSRINTFAEKDDWLYTGLENGSIYKTIDMETWTLSASFTNPVTFLDVVSNNLMAGLSNGSYYILHSNTWKELGNAGSEIKGIGFFANKYYILNTTTLSSYKTTGCTKFCLNQNTCSASCFN